MNRSPGSTTTEPAPAAEVDENEDEITLDSLRGLPPDELERLVGEIDDELNELHFEDDGTTLRELNRDQRKRFDLLMHIRQRALAKIQQHERIAAAATNPRAMEVAFGGHPNAPAAGPDDLLRGDQSVLDWMRRKGQLGAYGGRGVGSRSGGSGLSFDRWLRGMVTGEWQHADAELGVERELRALSEGTLTAGGHLVPTPLAGQIIDLARNKMRVMQAGAVTVPMTAQTLKVPRLTAEGSPGWKAENAGITDADLTFDAVTFTARTLVRLVKLSVELFEDADPSAEGVIAQSFAAQVALEVDRAALRGSGSAPEPRGVLNTSGVTVTPHGANGSVIGSPPAAGTMGWEFLAQAVGAVRNANFEPGAQVMAPRTDQSLGLLRDTTNQFIAPPRYLDGISRLSTKQVPTNLTVGTSVDCSEVYTGQWNQLMVGIRTSLRIAFLRERFIDNLQYGFLAYLRADVQLAQPAAFVVDTGVRG